MTQTVNQQMFFGQILVEEGILQAEDLRKLVHAQRRMPLKDRLPIGRLAVRENFLTQAQLLSLLDQHGWRLHLGELLVMRGAISLADLGAALVEQKKNGGMVGETLLQLGLIEQTALAEGLAEQCGVAFVPIANIPPDPELARWVNASFARLHGLVPIACRGRTLAVAIWQPRAMAAAADIEQASGLSVTVVLTTRKEIEERIEALYATVEDRKAA